MEMFTNNRLGNDDPARLRAYQNFSGNLEDILRAAHQAGVPVILSTVAVNLKDCPPFASQHSANLEEDRKSAWNEIYEQGVQLENAGLYSNALAVYQKAAGIDPNFADLQFRMGDCDLALTNANRARGDFERARDDDALDFRADSRVNFIIRQAASSHAGEGVSLLDAANLLAQKSPDGIPGFNLFYEHVHFNFAGNYLLAVEFAEKMKPLLPHSIAARDDGHWAPAELCDRRLAITARDRQGVWLRIFQSVTAPPFTGQLNHAEKLKFYEVELAQAHALMNAQTPAQATQIYDQALKFAPDDIFLNLNFVAFLEAEEDWAQAATRAQRCCELIPQVPDIYFHTAVLLVRAERIAEAEPYLSRAIAIRPDYVEAMNEMGEILANQQKAAEATSWFERAIRTDPSDVETYINLGFLQQNLGNADAAMANYQKAAGLNPGGPADYFNQANAAASAYRWDEMIACLQAAIKAKPAFWQARYQLGIQLGARGEFEEAQNQFSEAIRYRPDFIQGRIELATALAAQRKTNEALAEFRAALQLDPTNSFARQQIEMIKDSSQKRP